MEETMYQRLRGRSIGRHAHRSNDLSVRHWLKPNGYARRRYTFRSNGHIWWRHVTRSDGLARRGPASPWRWRNGRWRASTQEKKSVDWPRMFIVNTDTCDRGGSHWVAFHFPLVALAEFFDSLGNAPETYHCHFASVLIVNGPQYYYCWSRIQPNDTDTCGLYCLYYFKRRHRGMELRT
jgi:hypothetical protein